nr:MAG TPA: hypothetical protein [Caudoviricetes sp.]
MPYLRFALQPLQTILCKLCIFVFRSRIFAGFLTPESFN